MTLSAKCNLSLDIMKELKIPRFQSASRLTCATSLGEFVSASPQRARKVAGWRKVKVWENNNIRSYNPQSCAKRHLYISNNAPHLPPSQILHNPCFSFLLGQITAVPREIENNAYEIFFFGGGGGRKGGALCEICKCCMFIVVYFSTLTQLNRYRSLLILGTP